MCNSLEEKQGKLARGNALADMPCPCPHLDDTVKIAELADVSEGECAGLWALRRHQEAGSIQLSLQLGHGLWVLGQEVPATASQTLQTF